MVIERENSIGVDAVINRIQKRLDKKLPWSNLITIYPRCYTLFRDQLRAIEHYSGDGDYINLVTAEEDKCFFLVSDIYERVNNKYYSTTCEVFFTVELNTIKPNQTGRRDSEVHADVLNAIRGATGVMSVDSLVTRIESVFRDYDFQVKNDMQPFHCFKVILNIQFDPNEKCCC